MTDPVQSTEALNPEEALKQAILSEILQPPQPGELYIDVSSGKPYAAAKPHEAVRTFDGANYIAVDETLEGNEAFDRAPTTDFASIVRSPITKLPAEDGTADEVHVRSSLTNTNITESQFTEGIAEIARVLKTGGNAVFKVAYASADDFKGSASPSYMKTPQGMLALLKENGFETAVLDGEKDGQAVDKVADIYKSYDADCFVIARKNPEAVVTAEAPKPRRGLKRLIGQHAVNPKENSAGNLAWKSPCKHNLY